MNNKLLLGIVALVVIAGGAILLGGKGTNNSTSNPPPTVAPSKIEEQPATSSAAKTEETNVTITSSGFEPQTITVKAGGKVVWMNKSGNVANVSSAVHPTHLVYPALNLGNFDNGSSVSLIFDKPGTYKYHNHLNPGQTGVVIVE